MVANRKYVIRTSWNLDFSAQYIKSEASLVVKLFSKMWWFTKFCSDCWQVWNAFVSVKEIRSKWANLCSQYQRELRKVKDSTRTGAKTDDIYVLKWAHFKDMGFLSFAWRPAQSESTLSSTQEQHVEEVINCFFFILILILIMSFSRNETVVNQLLIALFYWNTFNFMKIETRLANAYIPI